MEFVTRAVVASLSRIEGSVMDQLLSIRNDLCDPAHPMGGRAALLYTSGWFVLWVEGTDAEVDAALKAAGGDSRNEHQKLLHRSRGPRELHEPIVVATTQSPMRPTHFARWVMHMKDEGAQLAPKEIWDRLGAPCLVGAARTPSRPTQQFALLSSDDHGPIDQLRKFGEHHASPVVYQRFAIARSFTPDLGMAYVDVPVESGAARVRLVSRRALAQPSVRRSMSSRDCIAILLGARPSVAIELATHVADALKGAQRHPAVHVVGEAGEPAAACVRLLERCGIAAVAAPVIAGGMVDLVKLLPALGLVPRGNSVCLPQATHGPLPGNRMDAASNARSIGCRS